MGKIKNKKAVSEMVAYVLLVVIALSMSIIVYVWMTKVSDVEPTPECPSRVALSVEDYICSNDNRNIILVVKNKGYFNISGYDIWGTSNKSKEALSPLIGEFADTIKNLGSGLENRYYFEVFSLMLNGTLKPGQTDDAIHVFKYGRLERLEKIKIQPFTIIDDKEAMCDKSIIIMEVDCDKAEEVGGPHTTTYLVNQGGNNAWIGETICTTPRSLLDIQDTEYSTDQKNEVSDYDEKYVESNSINPGDNCCSISPSASCNSYGSEIECRNHYDETNYLACTWISPNGICVTGGPCYKYPTHLFLFDIDEGNIEKLDARTSIYGLENTKYSLFMWNFQKGEFDEIKSKKPNVDGRFDIETSLSSIDNYVDGGKLYLALEGYYGGTTYKLKVDYIEVKARYV